MKLWVLLCVILQILISFLTNDIQAITLITETFSLTGTNAVAAEIKFTDECHFILQQLVPNTSFNLIY